MRRVPSIAVDDLAGGYKYDSIERDLTLKSTPAQLVLSRRQTDELRRIATLVELSIGKTLERVLVEGLAAVVAAAPVVTADGSRGEGRARGGFRPRRASAPPAPPPPPMPPEFYVGEGEHASFFGDGATVRSPDEGDPPDVEE